MLISAFKRTWNSIGPFSYWSKNLGTKTRLKLGFLKAADLIATPFRPNGTELEKKREILIAPPYQLTPLQGKSLCDIVIGYTALPEKRIGTVKLKNEIVYIYHGIDRGKNNSIITLMFTTPDLEPIAYLQIIASEQMAHLNFFRTNPKFRSGGLFPPLYKAGLFWLMQEKNEENFTTYIRNPLIVETEERIGFILNPPDPMLQKLGVDPRIKVIIPKTKIRIGEKIPIYIEDPQIREGYKGYVLNEDWGIFTITDTPFEGRSVTICAQYSLSGKPSWLEEAKKTVKFF
ncbi:MAG: hypothetical protein FD145_622 [Candidatus Saganbacteria bacterium]|uniref:Uncharacterized protein n=1 Tax=Candidatus Saganbacteria bacterium TaxID=2575572 RepID=A0A833P025_UNCSA|nr:MAG: hypothetical protein FD145_622 [Candidatus Saganbacteria bacterium]